VHGRHLYGWWFDHAAAETRLVDIDLDYPGFTLERHTEAQRSNDPTIRPILPCDKIAGEGTEVSLEVNGTAVSALDQILLTGGRSRLPRA
jgi:hypothetical protein